LSKEQISAFLKARKEILPLLAVAQERLLSIPLREIIDPASGMADLRRFATSEELQYIVMDVFKGQISVDTKLVREGTNPAVVSRVMLMTEEGLVPLVSATASQMVTNMFGGKTILSAESRSIRRALRELGLRAEFEIYDEDDRQMKSELAPKPKASESKAASVCQKPDFEQLDFVDDGDSLDKAPPKSNETKQKKTPSASTSKSSKTPSTSNSKSSKTQSKADKELPAKDVEEVFKPIAVNVDYSHEDWPNKKATNYPSILVKGIDNAKKERNEKMSTFVTRVLGSERFKGKSTITLRSLKTTDMETLYQYYVIDEDNSENI
jgi:hypothetical protein